MDPHKEETISLLTRHHQLLLDHKDQIMRDPYLRSCRLPLRFQFGALPPVDLRLGHLLILWLKVPRIAGKPGRILEAEEYRLPEKNKGRWVNPESQTIEVWPGDRSLYWHFYDMKKTFQDRLAVDLPRIIQQLSFPEEFSFSKQLRFAHEQFYANLRSEDSPLLFHQILKVSLHITRAGLVRVEILVPSLSQPVSSPGLINHKAMNYRELVRELLENLRRSTGFRLMEKTDAEQSLFFSRVLNPYDGISLCAPGLAHDIWQLFNEYKTGMQGIHQQLNITPTFQTIKNGLRL